MSKYQKAIDKFIAVVSAMYPGGKNEKMYRELFAKMSDDEILAFVKTELVAKKQPLPFYYSNLDKERLNVKTLFKLSRQLGVEPYQRLVMTDPDTGIKFKTPETYLVIPQTVRRQKQHLSYGISVSKNSKYTDILTGQSVGVSRNSGLSLPELYIMESKKHYSAAKEFIKVRGGDNVAYREAKRSVLESGGYRLGPLDNLGTVPTSTETMRAYWFGMCYESNW